MKIRPGKIGIFDSAFKEILSAEMIAVIGGIIAGTILAVYTDNFLIIPGMLIILPGFLEMRGNISGSFASRLISGLFLGVIKPSNIRDRIVKENITATFLLSAVVSFIFGLILFFFNYIFLNNISYLLLALPFIAGIIANIIEVPIVLGGTFYFFKKGHDPNNIMGPFITATGDITSIISLLIAFFILLWNS